MRLIWERYLLRELLKVFFLFLGCFFFLYSLIDYSLHMQDFIVNKKIHLSNTIIYYFYQFIKRADLLIPLALLISTLKVLFSLNLRGELVALQASGLSAKQILRPFFLIAALCTLFNYLSFEFILPSSLNFLDRFREMHFKHSYRGNRKEPIHVIYLKDRSKIIYQTEDKENKLFLDVFWIRGIDDIWRMKTLSSTPENPTATFVDHLTRNREGRLEKTESFDTYKFASCRWEKDPTGKGHVPFENRKMSALFKLIANKRKTTAFEYPQALTYLLHKTLMPLASFLVIIAAAPYCLRHSRTLPIFMTYAIFLFGFIAFVSLIDAAVILGENRIISPYLATLVPFSIPFLLCGWKYLNTLRLLSWIRRSQ